MLLASEPSTFPVLRCYTVTFSHWGKHLGGETPAQSIRRQAVQLRNIKNPKE